MNKLNDTMLRTIKGTGKAQKLSDGGGLFLYVTLHQTRGQGGLFHHLAVNCPRSRRTCQNMK